ncbi:MAG TPA: homoserine kinase [Chloroflexota bacterium]
MSSIVVRAPATSANLGAGFDCLGLALDLWNEVTATPGRLDAEDDANLILHAARATYTQVGADYPGFALQCTNRIIYSRGLGSSAAAITCGVLFANECLGKPLDESAVLDLAVRLEGHPDNIVPCVLGGARVALRLDDGRVVQSRISLALNLIAVCFVPDEIGIPTLHARGLLPVSVSHADAVFNVARASLMVAALSSGRADLLAEATRDRLHQPYRLPLFPAGATLLDAAMHAGALGSCVSGAGPTVLALCASDSAVDSVSQALTVAARREGVAGSLLRLGLTDRGAHVVA